MRVLVTGNLGYIGTVLVPELIAQNYDVVGFDAGFYKDCLLEDWQAPSQQILKDIHIITKNIEDELDWHPKVPIENGLASTVRWYIENQDWVKRVTSGEYRNYYKTVYQNEWGQILK